MNDETEVSDDELAAQWAAALDEGEEGAAEPEPQVERAEFDNLKPAGGGLGSEDENLEVILDIPVTIAMEIGRTKIPIRNLLQLNQGSVVELDRLAGEPMDVLVNGTLIAHGEVVVVNEKFGIRLTDVISPAERVKKLK
ncbi:flagellar motor switch protein FliN [Solemya pervernicosa gill symbiont]|uniref:Flagellar motor switch protein FliN n=1 Tax=Solemya pervernicosa gill symbiont TaxID=642797 RepID=A0A1T2LAK5_9GAMM|nr:flagellar motor switch protein FliN [Solemya pervernicosa gill symbiont]OOZ42133.1 flagellar motor switch protein FliN [Solemya pervernicosa gill symbiont]